QAAFRKEADENGPRRLAKPAALINSQLRVHDVGKVWMSVTNFGFFGSQDGAFEDASGKYLIAPSCMFPGGSNLTYLFQGALWIGAVIDTTNQLGQPILDTLVSIGNDGWWGDLFEMFPSIAPGGAIEVRSTRPSDVYPYGDTTGAKSEQDYVAIYTDTVTSVSVVSQDPNDGRPHIPLGIQITQRSYAWSYEYAEDFILFDFDIANIGHRDLKDLWVGLYIDADVYHSSEYAYGDEEGAQDDICGFDSLFVVEGDTNRINTAWIADNDGQPYDGAYDYRSPRGVSGVRVVRTPLEDSLLKTTFNWWISNIDPSLDWGPRKSAFGEDAFPGGGIGTPGGDVAKYKVMSNGEFDYDQIWCGYAHDGWISPPPDVTARNLANGYDTRYLFSFGPFAEIRAGDTLKLTTAYICGENFHSDPLNYEDHLKGFETDSATIQEYYNRLSFTDFATNAQWADWVYDNPGVDTDPDGPGPLLPDGYFGKYRITAIGDTFWYKGDGVPDFAGPPPPQAPILSITPGANRVSLLWDGNITETKVDIFSKNADFEGYRLYMSKTGRSDDYTLLGEYDLIDYDYTWWDTTQSPAQWAKWNKPPRRLDEFQAIHPDFDWHNFRMEDLDSTHYSPTDTYLAHWEPYGWNTGLDGIRVPDSTRWYQYELTNLSEAQGLFFAVTAFDYGNPVTKLASLETATAVNAQLVYPIATGAQTKVAVYPNPYIFTDATKPGGYLDRGWEDPDRSGNTVFDRRVKFQGLPPGWVLRIFTIDGDLVKQINQGDVPYTLTDDVCYWDLISRNAQAVVSGIYIYVIEGANGYHELGKLAIIK
ncbi:MAG TPA: hypothetical protein DEO84_05180, partial [candidate division Zixibacteria bacterium]|nr:hypothetical protein [candidate division Zixibacteria bacterium]